jgi:hypothetical protein
MAIPVIFVNIAPANYKIVEPQAFYVTSYTLGISSFLMPGPSEWPLTPAPSPIQQTWTWRQVGMLGLDQLPVGDQRHELPVRETFGKGQTWTWRQVGMLGLDVVPGKQSTELTPKAAPRSPYYGTEWNHTPMLGLDQLPVGDQRHELPVRETFGKGQTWALNLLETTLAPVVISGPLGVLGFAYQHDLLPRAPYRLEQTWTWRQVGMLGLDVVPGEQVTDLTPKAAARLPYYGTEWRQVGMLGQDVVPGKQVYALAPAYAAAPRASYYGTEWRQVGMLGLDQLPVGEQSTELPRAPFRLEQTWTLNLLQTTLFPTTPGPLGVLGMAYQYDTLPPRAPYRIEQTWTLNLLQTTLLPTISGPLGVLGMAYQYDLLAPRAALRIEETWTWRQVGMLGQDQLPVGVQATDLTPKPASRLPYYGTEWRQVDKIGLDQLPVGAITTELPRAAYRLEQTWTWRQVGMLGLDQLPVGAQVTDLAPKAPPRLPYYGTEWRQVDKLGLDRLPVGTQVYDTTTHRYVPFRLEQTTAWRQVGMLGLDRLPVGTQSFDLTPKPGPRSAYYGTEWRQVGMIGLDQLPIGEQSTELTPKAPLRGVDLSNWAQSTNLSLFTAPPDIFLSILKTAYALPERGPWQPDRSFMFATPPALIPPPPAITELHNQPFINASMGRMFGR